MIKLYFKGLLASLLLLISTNVSAYDFKVDGIYYEKTSDSEVCVSYNISDIIDGIYYFGNIVIPKQISINGYTYNVTSIGQSAFARCSGLTSIEIPNSVEYIDGYAFKNCI